MTLSDLIDRVRLITRLDFTTFQLSGGLLPNDNWDNLKRDLIRSPLNVDVVNPPLDEDAIRQIVREELAAANRSKA